MKTKAELLAKKVKQRADATGKKFVVAWGTECQATHKDMSHLKSDHEEADTKILHALDATADGATDLSIYSSGTNVFVLAIRRYQEMCTSTTFVSGKGANHRTIKLQPIVGALLILPKQPLFQHFTQSQALTTLGLFQGSQGKVACWKVFLDADDSVTNVLGKLGKAEQPDDDIIIRSRAICLQALFTEDLNTYCQRAKVVPI